MSIQRLLGTCTALGCVLACVACDRAEERAPAAAPHEPPAAATMGQDFVAEPAPQPAEALPLSLQTKVGRYKDLINGRRYTEAVAALREALPEMEEFVRTHPAHAEAHLELSGAYIAYMYILAQHIPPGPEMAAAFMEGVQRDYIGKARASLAVFESSARPDDPRLGAAADLRRWLEEIERSARRGNE